MAILFSRIISDLEMKQRSRSLKVLVCNKLVGGVIGKTGATINTIKETSGAKVKVVRIVSGVINFQQIDLLSRFPAIQSFSRAGPIV